MGYATANNELFLGLTNDLILFLVENRRNEMILLILLLIKMSSIQLKIWTSNNLQLCISSTHWVSLRHVRWNMNISGSTHVTIELYNAYPLQCSCIQLSQYPQLSRPSLNVLQMTFLCWQHLGCQLLNFNVSLSEEKSLFCYQEICWIDTVYEVWIHFYWQCKLFLLADLGFPYCHVPYPVNQPLPLNSHTLEGRYHWPPPGHISQPIHG